MPLNPRISDWSGKKVWLVGASSGIGEALAVELANRGAVLALSARTEEPLRATLAKAAPGSLVQVLDVTNSEAVDRACQEILNRWQSIDLVIWLAGTYQPMTVSTFDIERAKKTVDANVVGPLNGLAALLKPMLESRCRGLALVSSVAGYRGLPQSLVYGPTKAAVTNMAEGLYLDMHPRGIGVWVINPGFVKTKLTDKNEFDMPALITPEQATKSIIDGFASGRFEIHFPKRFTRTLKFFRTLPYRLYFAAVSRTTKR